MYIDEFKEVKALFGSIADIQRDHIEEYKRLYEELFNKTFEIRKVELSSLIEPEKSIAILITEGLKLVSEIDFYLKTHKNLETGNKENKTELGSLLAGMDVLLISTCLSLDNISRNLHTLQSNLEQHDSNKTQNNELEKTLNNIKITKQKKITVFNNVIRKLMERESVKRSFESSHNCMQMIALIEETLSFQSPSAFSYYINECRNIFQNIIQIKSENLEGNPESISAKSSEVKINSQLSEIEKQIILLMLEQAEFIHRKINTLAVAENKGEKLTLKESKRGKFFSVRKAFHEFTGSPLYEYHTLPSRRDAKIFALERKMLYLTDLGQAREVLIGTSGGFCHGFTEDWLLKMKENKDKSLDAILGIYQENIFKPLSSNLSQPFSSSTSQKSSYLSKSADHIGIDISERILNLQNLQDSSSVVIEQKTEMRNIERIIEYLENGGGINLRLQNAKDTLAHAVGICKTNAGYFFYDSNFMVVQSEDKKDFIKFVYDHLKKSYPEFKQLAYMPSSLEKWSLDASAHAEIDSPKSPSIK